MKKFIKFVTWAWPKIYNSNIVEKYIQYISPMSQNNARSQCHNPIGYGPDFKNVI